MLVRYWSTRGARVRRTPPCLKCPTCASVILSSLHFVVVEKKKKKRNKTRGQTHLCNSSAVVFLSIYFVADLFWTDTNCAPSSKLRAFCVRTSSGRAIHFSTPTSGELRSWNLLQILNLWLLKLKELLHELIHFFFLYLVLSKLNRMYQNEIF